MIVLDEVTRREQRAAFDALTDAIERADTVAICAHTSPDGDALGSELALARLIDAHWMGVKRVTCLLADDKPTPRHYRFLPGSERLVRPSAYDGAPDLFICVDLCVASRLAHARPVMERAADVFVLDHHPCERPFAPGYLRPEAAACGILVAEYARQLGELLTPDMANLLFVAIATDTGRFQYQNADAEAFAVASLLVDAGARPSEVSLNVYQSESLSYLHLQAIVMGRIRRLLEGRLAFSWVLWEDFTATGAGEDEADGLVDIVRSVDGTDVALLLRQVQDGHFRGNLRSKGALDVARVATALGGGGHPAAAGFTLDATEVDEALDQVLPLIAELMGVETDGTREAVR